MKCDRCGREPEGIAYTCQRCGDRFCEEHRLPETHHCPALSAEKARHLGESEPWFKDEFRLSNVEKKDKKSPSRERQRGESKPTVAATCEMCGKELLDHEVAGCPYCGEPYCGAHVGGHRSECDAAAADESGSESESQAATTASPVETGPPDRPGSKNTTSSGAIQRLSQWILEKFRNGG